MKTLFVTSKFLTICLLFTALSAMTFAAGVEGIWAFEASGTPPEYAKGDITIKQDDGKYQVVLTIGQMAVEGKEVVVENKSVNFSLYIDDSKVKVSLTMDGDNFTGKAETYDGTFPLKGKRK